MQESGSTVGANQYRLGCSIVLIRDYRCIGHFALILYFLP
jgi:hypothetical protein